MGIKCNKSLFQYITIITFYLIQISCVDTFALKTFVMYLIATLLSIISFLNQEIAASLKLCSESSNTNWTELCKIEPDYKSYDPPQPHPVIVKPILEHLEILDIDHHKETITVFLSIILSWKDKGLGVTKSSYFTR